VGGFVAAVSRCLPDADESEVTNKAVCLIAALNGLIQLHINRPLFPWPPLPRLIDESIDAFMR
jgi:hypothetical protein